jgi:uncharacterized protein YodC (DUF2158 family)
MTQDAKSVGDIVCLNSGGHLMTVISIEDNFLTCTWSVKGDVKSKSFPAAALKKSDDPPITDEFLKQLSVEDQRALAEALEALSAGQETERR